MDEERERKLTSLRNRVRSQLKSDDSSIDEKKPGLLEKATSKISEKNDDDIQNLDEEPLTISLSRIEQEFQRFASSNKENEKLRNVAAFCILAGAILGLLSGLMQLTGNPAELVENSQFFAIDDNVDVSGIVLFEDGAEFEGMIIEIYDLNTGKSYGTQVTGDDGFFVLKDIPQRPMRMEFSEEGYISVHITFIPDKATLHYITMHEGDDLTELGNIDESELKFKPKRGQNYRSNEHIGTEEFDREIHQKYLTHIDINNLKGLKIELIYKWKIGETLIMDRTHIHCSSSNIVNKKIGLTTFTKKKIKI